MSPRMYIPMMVTFTESEYLIIHHLMRELCVDDKQFSATVRLIVREWKILKDTQDSPTPKEDPHHPIENPTEGDDLPPEYSSL